MLLIILPHLLEKDGRGRLLSYQLQKDEFFKSTYRKLEIYPLQFRKDSKQVTEISWRVTWAGE